MKKAKLQSDLAKAATAKDEEQVETAQGFVLSRNEILERLVGDRLNTTEVEVTPKKPENE